MKVGIELEWPEMDKDSDIFLKNRGRDSNSLKSKIMNSGNLPGRLNAEAVYDGTVGLEIVSGTMDVENLSNWYYDIYKYVMNEYNAYLQPTGLMEDGNTAGMHIHMSPISEDTASSLYEISHRTWAKILFCTSVTESSSPVFRGGSYCRMEENWNNRYHVVNKRSGRGHYEWRLPEPVLPGHVEIISKFLHFLETDEETAIQYAQELLDNGDERITSIRRAKNIDYLLSKPGRMVRDYREINDEEVESKWRAFMGCQAVPPTYLAELDDEYYFIFDNSNDIYRDLDRFILRENRLFFDRVYRAKDLTVVEDESVENHLQSLASSPEMTRVTNATEELIKIIQG